MPPCPQLSLGRHERLRGWLAIALPKTSAFRVTTGIFEPDGADAAPNVRSGLSRAKLLFLRVVNWSLFPPFRRRPCDAPFGKGFPRVSATFRLRRFQLSKGRTLGRPGHGCNAIPHELGVHTGCIAT